MLLPDDVLVRALEFYPRAVVTLSMTSRGLRDQTRRFSRVWLAAVMQDPNRCLHTFAALAPKHWPFLATLLHDELAVLRSEPLPDDKFVPAYRNLRRASTPRGAWTSYTAGSAEQARIVMRDLRLNHCMFLVGAEPRPIVVRDAEGYRSWHTGMRETEASVVQYFKHTIV